MKTKTAMRQFIRKGFFFYVFTTLFIAIQFMLYIFHSQIVGLMDLGGWAFYLTSCISHAACIALPILLAYILLCLLRLPRVAATVQVVVCVLISCLVNVNEQVYQLYRFHINGLVLNMITGPDAGNIFNFDAHLYLKYIFVFCIIAAIYVFAWRLLGWYLDRCKGKRAVVIPILLFVGSTLFAHLYHIYAAFYQKQSVIISERLLPYYFPTTSYSLLVSTFKMTPPVYQSTDIGSGKGDMQYPLHDLQIGEGECANILLILIDSWNPRALTAECMPNVYAYACRNQWFQNHVSCSNGTRSSVFGIWYGLSDYYWNMAESSRITPAILDVAHQEGYTFRNYPSASQLNPPFGRVIFAKEKDVRLDTPGSNTYEWDRNITDDFIADITDTIRRHEPFLSFLFYDAPHSFLRPDGELRFQPSWDYADYSALNNEFDPTPFWNLYRNTCYETDKQIGRVLDVLVETGLDKSTMVIISGDHSQEFNENHKNYWGHNGNFSWYQIGVPLIMHMPGDTLAVVHRHRTTHYDVTPTIMRSVMHVQNPEEDYSMGRQLTDTTSRGWHIAGSGLNYAFIIEGDTILEKRAEGSLDVYDPQMNRISGYHFNVSKFNETVAKLNRYMKQ